MKVLKSAAAGTMESSDIMVTVSPGEGSIEIELDSTVEMQYGRAIRDTITETLKELEIDSARVKAVDQGALDCVIRARVQASAYRACESEDYHWEIRDEA